MCAEYTVAPITPAQVDRAYLLIRLAEPAMTIEEWRHLCRPGTPSFHDGGAPWRVGAVLVATGPRGYLHGLSVVGVARSSDGGPIEVPAFLAPSAVDPVGVSQALLQALVRLCRERGCNRLSVEIPAGDEAAYHAIGQAGATLGVELDRLAVELHLSSGEAAP
jgi:GNAT superfamily N-acetyltransferase